MLLDPSKGSKTTQLLYQHYPRIRWNHVLCALAVTNDDSLINLLADHDTTFPTSPQGVDHDIITQNIEFLLVFTLDVGGTGQSDKIDKSGFTDVGCDVFGSHLGVSVIVFLKEEKVD